MNRIFTRFTFYAILVIALGLLIDCSLSSNNKPTVFIVGDSTVKNGQGDGKGGLWGWGDPIRFHFDSTKVNVENHALGGTSSRTFQTKGLWAEVLEKVNPGDYVLIQFGHNDGGSFNIGRARASIKGIGEDSVTVTLEATGEDEVVHSYGWYLRKYINDTKSIGAIPIIITPIPRNDWKEGVVSQSGKNAVPKRRQTKTFRADGRSALYRNRRNGRPEHSTPPGRTPWAASRPNRTAARTRGWSGRR